MENVSESSQGSLQGIGEIRLIRLHQKVRRWPRELSESLGKWTQILPAQRWLLKRTRLFVARNVVSPMRSFAKEAEVSTPQGEETAQRVEERDKQRRPAL